MKKHTIYVLFLSVITLASIGILYTTIHAKTFSKPRIAAIGSYTFELMRVRSDGYYQIVVRNTSGKKFEWLELYNDAEVLQKWALSQIEYPTVTSFPVSIDDWGRTQYWLTIHPTSSLEIFEDPTRVASSLRFERVQNLFE